MSPYVSRLLRSADQGHILTFVYWLGILLLMFLSGAEKRASCSPALRSVQALSAENSTQPLSWPL
ncbi:MAG: hypothetical protein ACYDBH_08790, partial [Acidobacteriaceae bacterium]